MACTPANKDLFDVNEHLPRFRRFYFFPMWRACLQVEQTKAQHEKFYRSGIRGSERLPPKYDLDETVMKVQEGLAITENMILEQDNDNAIKLDESGCTSA